MSTKRQTSSTFLDYKETQLLRKKIQNRGNSSDSFERLKESNSLNSDLERDLHSKNESVKKLKKKSKFDILSSPSSKFIGITSINVPQHKLSNFSKMSKYRKTVFLSIPICPAISLRETSLPT